MNRAELLRATGLNAWDPDLHDQLAGDVIFNEEMHTVQFMAKYSIQSETALRELIFSRARAQSGVNEDDLLETYDTVKEDIEVTFVTGIYLITCGK